MAAHLEATHDATAKPQSLEARAMARVAAGGRFQAFAAAVRRAAYEEFDGDGGGAMREFGDAAAFGRERESFAEGAVAAAVGAIRAPAPAARRGEARGSAAAAGPSAADVAGRRGALLATQDALLAARCFPGKRVVRVGVAAGDLGGAGAGPRALLDGVASPSECAAAIRLALYGMRDRPRRGGKTSLGANAPLLAALVDRCRGGVRRALGVDADLAVSGAMLTRVVADPRESDGLETQRGYPYWNPHADSLNNESYEVSCVLYLNTAGVGFAGGRFAFLDEDADRVVDPVAGRLLAFTGGTDNFHQVRPVEGGCRFALAVWFRRRHPGGA